MIDMHTHILYGVDDGPESREQTIEMLAHAKSEKITDIIATSHACHPQYDVAAATVHQQLDILQPYAQQMGITLHCGHEVRIQPHLVELYKAGDVLPLANSHYLLLELPSSNVPQYTKNIVYGLLEEGITPIIAHPERNKGIAEKPERLERLVREGALAQVTAGSLSGHFGKSVQQLAYQLVEANLVHTYGSDAHNLENRPFLYNVGLDYLEKKKQLDAVDMLLRNNDKILTNERMEIWEPQMVKQKKWWAIFS